MNHTSWFELRRTYSTSAISEYDAALLVGMTENEYSDYMQEKTAVSKGADFIFNKIRYQVKANRPSGI